LPDLARRGDEIMNLFEFVPAKNNKRLGLISGLLLIGGAVMLLVTYVFNEIAGKWFFQLLAVGMCGVSIFLVSRYVMKNYIYAIISTEGGNDFTVTELQSKKKTTVCRISVSNIEKAVVIEPGNKSGEDAVKALIKQGKYKRFNYCADLFDEKCIYLLADECGEKVAIKLSWGEELEAYLPIESNK